MLLLIAGIDGKWGYQLFNGYTVHVEQKVQFCILLFFDVRNLSKS